MKGKYATQLLRNTVSAAILLVASGGLLPASAIGAADVVDNIFDCLNSSSFTSHKEQIGQ